MNRNHPYYAYGQMYDTSGNAVSGMVHFNGCAVGGNCATGGGDSDGFGDHITRVLVTLLITVGVVHLMVKVMEDRHCTGDKRLYLKVVLFIFKCSIVAQVHSNFHANEEAIKSLYPDVLVVEADGKAYISSGVEKTVDTAAVALKKVQLKKQPHIHLYRSKWICS